jgi:hypothetical protein
VTPLRFGRALALGAANGFSRPGPALLLGAASACSSVCATLLWMTGLAALLEGGVHKRLLGLVVAALMSWLLQAAILGGAVHQTGAALRGVPVLPLFAAIAAAAPRALPWAVLAGAAELAWNGWELLVGGSGLLLFLRGLLHGRGGGLLGALALALVGSLGPLCALFLQLVAEMALVRSVVSDEPPPVAGYEAARTLLARPWAPLGLLFLTAFLAAAVGGAAAVLSSMGPARPLRLLGAAAILQVAIASLAMAVAQLVRLSSFAALELGRTGELGPAAAPPVPAPPAPRAELVLDTGQVLTARVVEPPGGGTPP